MTHEPSILELNVSALLLRAYVPVRSSPAFRARLSARLAREIEHAPVRETKVYWRAAAALLVVAGAALALWIARTRAGGGGSRESFLARGETALRFDGAKDWRTLDSTERSRGIEVSGGRLELATAKASEARVWLGSAGRVDAKHDTSLVVESGAEQDVHALALDSGAIALERYASGGRFEITTPEGRLVLERGALAVAIVGADELPAGLEPGAAVRARLESGLAWLDTQPGRTSLALASDVYLRNGRIAVAAAPALDGSVLVGGERTPAASAPSASSAPSGATPDAARFTGHVRVKSGEAPPASFAVTLLREVRLPSVSYPERHAFEGTPGRFEISDARAGTYRVFVEARGYAVWQVDTPLVIAAGASAEIDVALERGVSVRGRVLDAATQRPIEGAVVLSEADVPSQIVPFSCDVPWMKDWLALARTDPDGRFEIPALSARRHVLRATREGFGASWSQRVDLSEGAVPSEITLALAPGGTVFGRVANEDGSPRTGAIVIASCMPSDGDHVCMSYGYATSGADGAFSIVDLAPGMYVVVHAYDRAGTGTVDPSVMQVQVERGRSIEVELPGRQRGTRLSGRVITADGAPFADADIMVQAASARGANDWRAERTHADGSFTFTGLAPTTYQVFVGRGLGQNFTWQSDVEVPDVPEHRVELHLDGGVIAGRVSAAATKQGLARAVLILEVEKNRDWQFCGRGFANADGSFEFPNLRAGNYRVHAYATSGCYGPEHTADIWVGASNGPRDVELALAPGAALKVRVVDRTGAPIARAALEFVDRDGQVVQHTQEDETDTHGELSIPGIRPGPWTVRAARHGFAPASLSIELTAGEERAVELTLEPDSQAK